MGNQRREVGGATMYGRKLSYGCTENRATFSKPTTSTKHLIAGQTVVGAVLVICSCSIVLAKVLELLSK